MNSNIVSKLALGSNTLSKLRGEIRQVMGMLMSGLYVEEIRLIRGHETFAVGDGTWAIRVYHGLLEVWHGIESPVRLFTARIEHDGRLVDFVHATIEPHLVPFFHSEFNTFADAMIAHFRSAAVNAGPYLNAARYAEHLRTNA